MVMVEFQAKDFITLAREAITLLHLPSLTRHTFYEKLYDSRCLRALVILHVVEVVTIATVSAASYEDKVG